jgi:GntR family transcriptional regulator
VENADLHTPERFRGIDPSSLNRSGFVPLYYQLQELLKEGIESGVWAPGDMLPSEPELARQLGVSRVVVRQALAILQDDRQIVRVRGRGTFVATPKLDHRAAGLSRLLVAPRDPQIEIHILDKRVTSVEPSVAERLEADRAEALRITTLISARGLSIAIGYSFFRPGDVPWLEARATVGRPLPSDLLTSDHGVQLTGSTLSIETSQCGRFEAAHFGIAPRSAVFLVLCVEHCSTRDGERPFELARVEYRGDILQLRVELDPEGRGRRLEARFGLNTS